MLRTALSCLHVHVFAQTAGVFSVWAPARACCLVLQINPDISSKADSGVIQLLAAPRTRFPHLQVHVSAQTAGVAFVWPPARAFCLFLQTYL